MRKFTLILTSLTLSLYAHLNITAAEKSLFVLDQNSSLYWKGYAKLSYNTETNTTGKYLKLLDNINEIETKNNTFFAIDKNGNLYGWGKNYADSFAGLLGNNDNKPLVSPVKIELNSPLSSISTDGYTHTIAVTRDGKVYAWGDSLSGDLGVKGANDTEKPLMIPTLSDIKSVASGGWFSLAIDKNGTLYGWGRNYYGYLGLGDRQERDVPVKNNLIADIKQIAADWHYAVALTNDGKVYTWGLNTNGVLGNSDAGEYETEPVRVKNLNNITIISARNNHILALDKNGNVYAWGSNSYGEIGNSTTDNANTPFKLPLANIIDIAAGDGFSLALDKNGTLYGWGKNDDHILTDDNTTKILTPVKLLSSVKIKTTLTKLQPDQVTEVLKKGWNLTGVLSKKSLYPDKVFKNYLVWLYRDKTWYINSDIYKSSKYKTIDKINPGEGFWVKLEENTTVKTDKLDYDLNQTDAFYGSLGWSLLSSGTDGNISKLLKDNFRKDSDRKIVWKYSDNKWQYYTNDQNLSNSLTTNGYPQFDGFIKRGEGFWVYTTGYLYDYRYFDSSNQTPAYDENISFVATDRDGILSLFEIKNNFIKDIKHYLAGDIRDYKMDSKGRYIFISHSNSNDSNIIDIIKNDKTLKKISSYQANGFVWSMNYSNSKLWIKHSNTLEVVDVSDPYQPTLLYSLPCYSSYKNEDNFIISVEKDNDDNVTLDIFNKNSSKVAKNQIIKANMIDATIFTGKNGKIYVGYHGYKNYPDSNSYISGLFIKDMDNNTTKNIIFGDISIIPFGIKDDKIYTTLANATSWGLKVIDDDNRTIYSYDFDSKIYSFRIAKILKNGKILVLVQKNDGFYLNLFDEKLKFLSSVKLSDAGIDLYLADEGDDTVTLFPKRLADDPEMYIISFKNDNLKIVYDKKLSATGSRGCYFINTSNPDIKIIIEGKLFQIVNISKLLQ